MDDTNVPSGINIDPAEIQAEIDKERQYGGRGVETAVGEALNTALFNIPEAAYVASGGDPEDIRQLREKNAEASLLGTGAGIVVPAAAAVLTGGAAVPAELAAAEAAKATIKPTIAKTIAKGIAAPVRVLEPAGAAAERLTESLLPKAVSPGARSIAKMAARGAAEGSIIGTGEGIGEIAREDRDLSAEALLASAAEGALGGAIFGSAVGGLTYGGEKAFKATGKFGEGAARMLREGYESLFDQEKQVFGLLGRTISKEERLAERLDGPETVNYVKNVLNADDFDTAKSFKVKNDKVLETAGQQIDKNNKEVDTLIRTHGSPITREQAYQPMIDELEKIKRSIRNVGTGSGEIKQIDDFLGELTTIKDASKKVSKLSKVELAELNANELQIKRKLDLIDRVSPLPYELQREQAVLQKELANIERVRRTGKIVAMPFNATEYQELLQKYQKMGYSGGDPVLKFKGTVAAKLRGMMRDTLNDVAKQLDHYSPGLAERTLTANRNYHIGKVVEGPINDAAAHQPDLTSPFAFLAGTVGRVAKNVAFVHDVGRITNGLKDAVATTIEGAFMGKGRAAKLQPAAVNVFVRSILATDENGNKPKNQQQAMQNVTKNLDRLVENPEDLVDLLAKKTSVVSQVSPETGAALQQRIAASINFLRSKLPRSAANPGAFPRAYVPSSMEVAKFSRYMQVVERPLSVLEELKRGTLTREHVEALQATAPEIYRLIQKESMKYLGTPGLKLSYEKKLQIGILLNVPADSALQPQNLLNLQQNMQQQPQQAQPGPQFRPSAINQTGMSSRLSTGTEKVAKR